MRILSSSNHSRQNIKRIQSMAAESGLLHALWWAINLAFW